jgi:hypothetical protein
MNEEQRDDWTYSLGKQLELKNLLARFEQGDVEHTTVLDLVDLLVLAAYKQGKHDGVNEQHERTWGAPNPECEHSMQHRCLDGHLRCASCEIAIEP